MNKNKKEKLIPELRFPEFKEEWNKTSLENIASLIPGYAFKSQKMQKYNGRYQILKMANIYKSSLAIDRSPSFWNDLRESLKKYLLRAGDIVLTLTGTVGKQDYGYSIQIPSSNKFLLNQRLVCLREISRISDHGFLGNYIQTREFLRKFFASSRGGTGNQSNVGIDDLKNIKVNYPTLPEQQKISSFLSLIDRKIELLNKKKELLEIYKKGVMQKIFNRDIRFKDINGNNYPEWEEKRLGEILGERNERSTIKNQYPILTSSKKGIFFQEEYFDKQTASVNNIGYKIIHKGDLTYRSMSDTGSFTFNIQNLAEKGLVSPAYPVLIVNNESIRIFLEHYLNNAPFLLKQIKQLREGGTRLALSTSKFKKLRILLPNKDETKEITKIFQLTDNLNYKNNLTINLAQNFKKGLLQRMFI